jgi:hypothetical protein
MPEPCQGFRNAAEVEGREQTKRCTTPPKGQVASVRLPYTLLPSPDQRGLGLRILSCRGHFWVHSRYGPVTRSPSRGWFCRLASSVSFPPRRQPKLRGSDSCPGGTHFPLNMPAFAGRTMAWKPKRFLLRRPPGNSSSAFRPDALAAGPRLCFPRGSALVG